MNFWLTVLLPSTPLERYVRTCTLCAVPSHGILWHMNKGYCNAHTHFHDFIHCFASGWCVRLDLSPFSSSILKSNLFHSLKLHSLSVLLPVLSCPVLSSLVLPYWEHVKSLDDHLLWSFNQQSQSLAFLIFYSSCHLSFAAQIDGYSNRWEGREGNNLEKKVSHAYTPLSYCIWFHGIFLFHLICIYLSSSQPLFCSPATCTMHACMLAV